MFTNRQRLALLAVTFSITFVVADGQDFSWLYRGAEQLLAGENPYDDPRYSPENAYPWDFPLYYPLPAVLIAVPFTVLPYGLAASLFAALSAALLTFALTQRREDLHRLLVFLSACYYGALVTVQWSPLIMAAYFLPAGALVALLKPTLAIPVVVAGKDARRWIWLGGGGALLLGTVVLMPSWPFDWLGNAQTSERHLPPILKLLPWSPILLLAATRWRQPNAKLFLLLLFVPQYFNFYDQVLLWLLPVTWRGSLGMVAASWTGFAFVEVVRPDMGYGVALQVGSFFFLYLPALLVVLLDSREGHVRSPVARQESPHQDAG